MNVMRRKVEWLVSARLGTPPPGPDDRRGRSSRGVLVIIARLSLLIARLAAQVRDDDEASKKGDGAHVKVERGTSRRSQCTMGVASRASQPLERQAEIAHRGPCQGASKSLQGKIYFRKQASLIVAVGDLVQGVVRISFCRIYCSIAGRCSHRKPFF
ncbi:hypothetical protein BU16DRAFT_382343 [Lophium mytilinum]|uniref:Uncharacterized protein n=1 Tax=Lophium mytilinum TaxID=390894 RepID=A0A6A6QRP0_9PEZI|nr:hypothetical protein BU16DRAFT_382343 [Lophium mytilinum]